MSFSLAFEVTWQSARELSHRCAEAAPVITLPILLSHGYIVAKDVTALGDMPPFAASQIDGWAVSGPGPWKPVGDSLAGHEYPHALALGECIHTATGAVIPTGATAALKDEESQQNGEFIVAIGGAATLLDASSALPYFHDVRPSGYEATAGEVLIPRGTKLTPAIIGVAAAAGHDVLSVFKKIVVDVFIFGDELLFSGPSREGKVRDSLGPQLPFWITQIGAEFNEILHIPDTLADHISAISQSRADLIITTGGTAAGPADYLHNAIAELKGELIVDSVLVRPGYHQLLAVIGNKVLLGLPGNPQSAVIGLLTLAVPFVAGATGQKLPNLETRFLPGGLVGLKHETRLVLCTQTKDAQGRQTISPVAHLASSMLRGFVLADGYAVIPPGGADSGETVNWISLG